MDTFTMSQALGQAQRLIVSSPQAPELDLQTHFIDEDMEIWRKSRGLEGRESHGFNARLQRLGSSPPPSTSFCLCVIRKAKESM